MSYEKLAMLRNLLAGMEHDLKLDQLPETQRNIIYAAELLDGREKPASVNDIMGHPLVVDTPRATFFRALKGVVEAGYLRKVGHKGSGYVLNDVVTK